MASTDIDGGIWGGGQGAAWACGWAGPQGAHTHAAGGAAALRGKRGASAQKAQVAPLAAAKGAPLPTEGGAGAGRGGTQRGKRKAICKI